MHSLTGVVLACIKIADRLLVLLGNEFDKPRSEQMLPPFTRDLNRLSENLRQALERHMTVDRFGLHSLFVLWRGSSWRLPGHICDLIAIAQGLSRRRLTPRLPSFAFCGLDAHSAAMQLAYRVLTTADGDKCKCVEKPLTWYAGDATYFDALRNALAWLRLEVRREGAILLDDDGAMDRLEARAAARFQGARGRFAATYGDASWWLEDFSLQVLGLIKELQTDGRIGFPAGQDDEREDSGPVPEAPKGRAKRIRFPEGVSILLIHAEYYGGRFSHVRRVRQAVEGLHKHGLIENAGYFAYRSLAYKRGDGKTVRIDVGSRQSHPFKEIVVRVEEDAPSDRVFLGYVCAECEDPSSEENMCAVLCRTRQQQYSIRPEYRLGYRITPSGLTQLVRAGDSRGPTLTPDAKPSAADARTPRTPRRKKASKELVIDEDGRRVFWNGKPIDINSQADFDAMVVLGRAGTAVAKYLDLDRAIKPEAAAPSVTALKKATPEVKEALSHINKALCNVGCPSQYKSVRKIGYRLAAGGVCPTFAPRSHDE